MADSYRYRKSFHKQRFGAIRRRLWLLLLLLLLLGLAYVAIEYDLLNHNRQKPVISQVQIRPVSSELQTFKSTYFQFQDKGKWALSPQESTSDKFVYYKYRGLVVEHQLMVYINQVPIPLYLAVSRALPVRIVNGNSFDVVGISGPCGSSYGPQELHKVKMVSLNNASMLCDPDTPQYSVVLAEVNGDYRLKLNRPIGAPVQFVVIYKDLRNDPIADTIKQIAGSFQAL